jgi:hypothetical protein
MKWFGFICILYLCLSLPVAAQERNPNWQTVSGTVVDEQDQPVEGARVVAEVGNGRVPIGKSDANGQFSLFIQRPGSYTVYAEHLEKGYPAAFWAFYGKLWQPGLSQVTVDETLQPTPVRIKLGPKAGRLVLTILDGTTNEPIEKGLVELSRVGEPLSKWSISTAWPKGQYEILTPEVPFTISFQIWRGPIPEYHGGVPSDTSGGWVPMKAWDDNGQPFEIVQVNLGERKEVTVRLK